jgi:hypothetical protein
VPGWSQPALGQPGATLFLDTAEQDRTDTTREDQT